MEQYGIDVVGLTSTHSLGSSTEFLSIASLSYFEVLLEIDLRYSPVSVSVFSGGQEDHIYVSPERELSLFFCY